MTKTQKIFSLALSSFTAFILTASAALAVGVKPVRTELDIDPGATATATIRVINPESFAITVRPETTVYTKNDENGYPVSGDLAANDPMNISDWISFIEDVIEIEPNSQKEVNFTVTVPEDAEPGGRYASILYVAADAEEAAGIKIQTAVPSLILIKVNGQEIHSGSISNFEFKNEKIIGDRALIFGVDFENFGNVHEKPKAVISITDENGEKLNEIASYKVDGSDNILIEDSIPINLGGGNVLPGSERTFLGEWNKNIRSGKFIATLVLDYADRTNITRMTEIEILENMKVDLFEVDQREDATDFLLRLTNSGNVFERAEGRIEIRNEFNELVASPEIPEDIAYIEPGSTATVTIPWMQKFVPKGKYVATLVASYGFTDAPLTAEATFSSDSIDYVLVGMIGGGIAIAILLVVVIALLVRNKKSKNPKKSKSRK